MRTLGGVLLLSIIILAPSLAAQELSTSVFPSEDELHEAYLLGEISFQQYVLMLELLLEGVDSTSLYLYDEILNLSYFRQIRDTVSRPLEKIQQTAFEEESRPPGERGELRYRMAQRTGEDDRSSYTFSGRYLLRQDLITRLQIRREFTGRERCIRRSIIYKPRADRLDKLTVGTFTERYGAGTVIGHRGKILSYSYRLDEESFLYPDYGGFNGVSADGSIVGMGVSGMISFNRDTNHELLTSGLFVQRRLGSFRPGVVAAINRLKHRSEGNVGTDGKIGLNLDYRYLGGYFSAEMTAQEGDFGKSIAGVVEGRHRMPGSELRYAGWAYGDAFADLSSGSKAGNVRIQKDVEELDFAYSTKREGQEGALLRTVVLPADRMRLINSLLYAGFNRDISNLQVSTALVYQASPRLELQADFLNTTKRRRESHAVTERIEQETRFEARYRHGLLSLRGFVGYTARNDGDDHVSVFLNVRLESADLGRIDCWTNLSRLHKEGIAYGYFYIQNTRELTRSLHMVVKYSHAYTRSTREHRPAISMEITTLL